jgi:hypothetical protein
MSDERKRSRAWIWGAPAAALVLYLLSYIPFVIALNWLLHWQVLSNERATAVNVTTYAPLIWGEEHSWWSTQWVDGLIKPLVPHGN